MGADFAPIADHGCDRLAPAVSSGAKIAPEEPASEDPCGLHGCLHAFDKALPPVTNDNEEMGTGQFRNPIVVSIT